MDSIKNLLRTMDNLESKIQTHKNRPSIGRNAYIDTYRLYTPSTRYLCNHSETYTNDILTSIRQLVGNQILSTADEIQAELP